MYVLDVGETDPAKKKANENAVHDLDEKAKEMGVTILPEMGMDPGTDLILCGQAVRDLDPDLRRILRGFRHFIMGKNF